ncbi:MAG: Rv3235 family protein [Streptosporangiaceae bacterium]
MQQIPAKQPPGRPARPADLIRGLVVPQVAPPYDDEPTAAMAGFCPDATAGWPAAKTAVSPGPRGPDRDPGKPAAPQSAALGASSDDPDAAGAWPGQFAQVLAETLAGSRPHRQLAAWTTEQARRQIRQLGPLFATGDRPLVRRIMTAAPAGGVLELTAVVGFGSRVRVLAVRLERAGTGRSWCCTAIESA